jgi:RNA polymerase sigma factor (sigma-70 family)
MDFFAFDDDYVRRLRDRDARTEEHFFVYFHELLRIKLRGRLRSSADVEDVCQEVFLRVLTKLREPENPLRDGTKLGAYVNGFCNNILFERYRINVRAEEQLDEYRHDSASSEDIVTDFLTRETRDEVHRILDEIGPPDSDLLRAVFLDEEDKDVICKRFNVTRNHLRLLLFRARKKYRDWKKKL